MKTPGLWKSIRAMRPLIARESNQLLRSLSRCGTAFRSAGHYGLSVAGFKDRSRSTRFF